MREWVSGHEEVVIAAAMDPRIERIVFPMSNV